MTKKIKRGPEVVGNIATYYGEAFGDVLAIFTVIEKGKTKSVKRARKREQIKLDYANCPFDNFTDYANDLNAKMFEALGIKILNCKESLYDHKKEMEYYKEQVQAEIKAQALAKVRKEIDEIMSQALVDVAMANAKGIRAVALTILDNIDDQGKVKQGIKIDTLLALLAKTKLELWEPWAIISTADTSKLKDRLAWLGIT